MRKGFKRTIGLLLVVCLIAGLLPAVSLGASAQDFSDVSSGHWAYSYINELTQKGIINGMGDGSFAPDAPLTRAQYMKLLTSVLGVGDYGAPEISDISPDNWAYQYVAEGLSRGIILPEEMPGGVFDPNGSMDRATMALWTMRGLGVDGQDVEVNFSDVPNDGSEMSRAIATSQAMEIINGYPDGTFMPNKSLSRAEASAVTKRVMDKYNEMNTPRNAKNTIEYSDGVIVGETKKGQNQLIEQTDTYCVIGSPDSAISALKAGDLFVLKPSDLVPGGYSGKVVSTSPGNGRITVYTESVGIDEICDSVDIYNESYASQMDLSEAVLGEGVTLMSTGDDAELMETSASKELKFKVSKTIGKIGEGTVSGSLKINGEVTGTLKSVFDFQWEKWWESPKATVDLTSDLTAEVNLTGSINIEIEIPLATSIKIKIGSGDTATELKAGLFLLINPKGEASIYAKVTSESIIGAGFKDWGFYKHKTLKSSAEFGMEASVSLKVGPELTAELKFLGDVLKLGATAEAGVEVSGSCKPVNVNVEALLKGEIDMDSGDIELIGKDEVKYHACGKYCVDGKFTPFLSAGIEFTIKCGIEYSFEPSIRIDLAVVKFHWSPDTGFGMGACENYKTLHIGGGGVSGDQKVVYANSAAELKAAIAPNTEIRLGDKSYDMGYAWTIDGVSNLAIVGSSNSKIISDTYFKASNCPNLRLENLTIDKGNGLYTGLGISGCDNFKVSGCKVSDGNMFFENSNGTVSNSSITGSSSRIVDVYGGEVTMTGCTFSDNSDYGMGLAALGMCNGAKLNINGCSFSNNKYDKFEEGFGSNPGYSLNQNGNSFSGNSWS